MWKKCAWKGLRREFGHSRGASSCEAASPFDGGASATAGTAHGKCQVLSLGHRAWAVLVILAGRTCSRDCEACDVCAEVLVQLDGRMRMVECDAYSD